MAPPRKYPAGEEPWTRALISKQKWRRLDLESRLTPTQLAARKAHTRATLKAAAERRLAAGHPSVRRSHSRLAVRVKNANPVPGVVPGGDWGGRGESRKGKRRPPMGLDTQARAGWRMAHAARRSLALRAALRDGSWAAWMARDPEFGQLGDHDATLDVEQVA